MSRYGWVEVTTDEDPPGFTNPEVRAEAEATIDAIVARDLFDLTRNEYEYVLDRFDGVRAGDIRSFGEYRSKRLALEAYDSTPSARSDVDRMAGIAPLTTL